MGLDPMLYIPSFAKALKNRCIDTQHGDFISLILFFNKERRLKKWHLCVKTEINNTKYFKVRMNTIKQNCL
jgi:hypothetical protein